MNTSNRRIVAALVPLGARRRRVRLVATTHRPTPPTASTTPTPSTATVDTRVGDTSTDSTSVGRDRSMWRGIAVRRRCAHLRRRRSSTARWRTAARPPATSSRSPAWRRRSTPTARICPETTSDVGGIWVWDGDDPGLYALDADFWAMMTAQGYEFVDADGNISITDPGAGAADSSGTANSCLEATADGSFHLQVLLPDHAGSSSTARPTCRRSPRSAWRSTA